LIIYTAEKLDDHAQLDEGIIGTDNTILKRNAGKHFCSRNVNHCKENRLRNITNVLKIKKMKMLRR
jgi:hypothetical protein